MAIPLKDIRNYALLNGLILGAVLLFLDIVALYVLAKSGSFGFIALAYLFIYLIIPLAIAIILIKRLRKKVGNYWSFREATSGIFITFLVGSFLSSLGNFLFIKVNPGIITAARDNFVNVFTRFMSKINAETHKVDEVVENIEGRFALMSEANFNTFFSSLLSSIIVLFIVSLIFAAIFKRDHPVTLSPQEL